MTNLDQKQCVPCRGGVPPMKVDLIQEYLGKIDRTWKLDPTIPPADGGGVKLVKEFEFKDFNLALKFINQVGEIAETEQHHPDIHLTNWNKVKIVLFTHKIKGLHSNDFILAAKIDKL